MILYLIKLDCVKFFCKFSKYSNMGESCIIKIPNAEALLKRYFYYTRNRQSISSEVEVSIEMLTQQSETESKRESSLISFNCSPFGTRDFLVFAMMLSSIIVVVVVK